MAKTIDFEQALYDRFGQIKDFILGIRIASYFYKKGKKDVIDEVERIIEENEDGCLALECIQLRLSELKGE